ncbi:HK97 gp10 family phage protein [Escherichia coli]|nr:HK97 gp10 family phage protein [Escherichia coli]
MAKAWDIEPSIFAGMIEEDVGLKIRYIAIQILTAIDIAAPVDTGRFRNNNLVSLQHPDFGISDNVDPNGTIAVQRGIGVISKAANYGVIYIQNNLLMQRLLKTVIHNKRQLACMPTLFMVFYRLTNEVY